MALIGFHFTKIVAEKKKAPSGKVNAKSNLALKEAKEAKVNMGSNKRKGIEFLFQFVTKYEPNHGSLDIQGAVVYMGNADVVDKILKDTKQKLPDAVKQEVYNFLLAKCNIQALIIERDMALPPHLQLPRLDQK